MIGKMFNYSDQMVQNFIPSASPEVLQEKLNTMADAIGDEGFAKRVAREIVKRTEPHLAIPEIYSRYRPLVHDGIEFFLSRMGRHRLLELAGSQSRLDPDADTQERLPSGTH